MEELVPVKIKHVTIHTDLDIVTRENIEYYNIYVKDCPEYVQNPFDPYKYTRDQIIHRYQLNGNGVSWPDHPLTVSGDHKGAIIIILSLDNKVLIIRNGKLWGLPKGVRNYTEFLRLRELTLNHYKLTGEILCHSTATFIDEESEKDNITREAYEETGISLLSSNLDIYKGGDQYGYTRFIYHADFLASDYCKIIKQNGTDHENDELRWVSINELIQLVQQHQDVSKRSGKIFNLVSYKFLQQYLSIKR